MDRNQITNPPDLPLDIWRKILSYFKPDELSRILETCKDWRNAIDNPELGIYKASLRNLMRRTSEGNDRYIYLLKYAEHGNNVLRSAVLALLEDQFPLDESRWSGVLVKLAEHGNDELKDKVLESVTALTRSSVRAFVLMKLADHGNDKLRNKMLEEHVNSRRLHTEFDHANVLETLAQYGDDEFKGRVQGNAQQLNTLDRSRVNDALHLHGYRASPAARAVQTLLASFTPKRHANQFRR
jgi:hypothetical protein